MSNQQSHLNSFNHYIQNLNNLKKDLESIKKLTDPEEKYNQANLSLSGHSTKFSLALGHYDTGKLWEISGCNQSLNEYSRLISELRTLETEAFKQLKATQCAYCKKKNLTNPYVYKDMDGYKTVFCDNSCLNKHQEKINKINNSQKNKRERERAIPQRQSAPTVTKTFQVNIDMLMTKEKR